MIRKLAVYLFLAILIGCQSESFQPSKPSAADTAAEAKRKKNEAMLLMAMLAEKQIHDSMRNPDSFQLVQVVFTADDSVCYEFRAQDGLGRMNLYNAVVTEQGDIRMTHQAGFVPLWNKECENKKGSVMTAKVDALYKDTVKRVEAEKAQNGYK